MEDPVSITLKTFERLAAEIHDGGSGELESDLDRDAVENFLMRTGRPLPRVVVLCGDPRDRKEALATRCRQVTELGGDAIGVAGPEVLRLARSTYPEGEYLEGDFRELPVEKDSFDGAWTGTLLAHIPQAEVAAAMQSVHDALRPGALLYARVPTGRDESLEEDVYRTNWRPERLASALATLNFDLLETTDLEADAAMLFRREY